MAVAEKQAYRFIPPPPLPEFYLTKKDRKEASKSSSSSPDPQVYAQALVIQESSIPGDEAFDVKPRHSKLAPPPAMPLVAMPPGANAAGRDVPPLAIYHICRLCLRPRSPRYHREHPIPLDGVPPPPGICRRCRVTSVEETKKVAEVVTQSRSNDIKIGMITPFVPDEDIISNEQMRRMKLEKYLRGRSNERHERHIRIERSRPREDIVYRHVRVVEEAEEPEPVPKPRKKKVMLTAQDAIENFNDQPPPEPSQAPKIVNTSMQVEPTDRPVPAPAKSGRIDTMKRTDSAKASGSTQSSSKSSQSGHATSTRASVKVTKHSHHPSHTDSDIRRLARDEIERYRMESQKAERSESEIRRISREEVERYRQAERKLESHRDPYAHGKLVPVERRIDVEKDIVDPAPWTQLPEQQTSVKVKSKTTVQTEDQFSIPPADADKSEGRSRRSERVSSPKWHRELSIERRSSRASEHPDREHRKTKVEENRRQTAAPAGTSEHSTGVKLREVYDEVQESGPPRWSSSAEPYVTKVSREPATRGRDVVEVIEEIDLPSRSRVVSYRRPTEAERQPPVSRGSPPPAEVHAHANMRREEVREISSPPPQPPEKDVWSRSSRPSHAESWYGGGTVRTVDTQSSKHWPTSGGGRLQAEPREMSPPKTDKSERSTIRDRVSVHSAQSSEKTYWPQEQDFQDDPREPSKPASGLPYPEARPVQDREMPATKKPARSDTMRDDRAAKNNTEYIYTERIVQPADRPPGWWPFDDGVPAHVEVVEEFASRVRPTHQAPPRRQHKERRKVEAHDSEESNHVRFNTKVDVSPTPPDSDASSSEFRGFHSFGRRSSRQVDGHESPELDEDLLAEYERRGRARSRNVRSQASYGRASYREQESHREETVKPRQEGRADRDAARSNAWVDGGRPLARALSESPSREELVNGKRDGRGLYQPEKKFNASTQAHDGSRESRTWSEDDQFGGVGSIGGRAQLR